MSQNSTPRKTPLHAWHIRQGARMVPFAGYEMPVQYAGIVEEHRQAREQAALFDVSHMCQLRIDGPVEVFERLVPGDLAALGVGRARYTMLTNEAGGVIDDLIATRTEDGLLVVLNASRRAVDLAHVEQAIGTEVELFEPAGQALLALQGPAAADVLKRLVSGVRQLRFMQSEMFQVLGMRARISRLGYTGEDGFEISLPGEGAEELADRLLAEREVAPAGLGARDSLRLEAGLALYGHELDETISPIEAGLRWTISKRRRAALDFPGGERIGRELEEGPGRKLVGIRPDGRRPARDGAEVRLVGGATIGRVTSGGFGPSVGAPIAMALVGASHATTGTEVELLVRGKVLLGRITDLPFQPHRYHR